MKQLLQQQAEVRTSTLWLQTQATHTPQGPEGSDRIAA